MNSSLVYLICHVVIFLHHNVWSPSFFASFFLTEKMKLFLFFHGHLHKPNKNFWKTDRNFWIFWESFSWKKIRLRILTREYLLPKLPYSNSQSNGFAKDKEVSTFLLQKRIENPKYLKNNIYFHLHETHLASFVK